MVHIDDTSEGEIARLLLAVGVRFHMVIEILPCEHIRTSCLLRVGCPHWFVALCEDSPLSQAVVIGDDVREVCAGLASGIWQGDMLTGPGFVTTFVVRGGDLLVTYVCQPGCVFPAFSYDNFHLLFA